MAVQYSPLCDTDLEAYLAYCLASYGSGVDKFVAEFGARGCLRGSRGSGDVVSDVVVAGGSGSCKGSSGFVALCGSGFGVHVGCIGHCCGGPDSEECRSAERLASDSVGGSKCGSGCDDSRSTVGSDNKYADGVQDADERASVGLADVASGVSKVDGRGRHYLRNQRKKNNRRVAKGRRDLDVDWRQRATSSVPSVHKGVFSECTVEVQRELRESRAKMLIEKNKAAASQAAADKVKVDAMVKARVFELDIEARRIKLDENRESYIKKKLSSLPVGYAETVASEGLESAVPTLSSGSVSPNSSISVDQVNRMEDTIKKLTERVAQLTAEAVETSVKTSVSIDALKSDLREAKGRGPLPSLSQRGGYVSDFSFIRR